MPNCKKGVWMLGIALAVVVGGVTAPPADAASPRMVVSVDEPFEVNGHFFEGGELSLRPVNEYNPVATLNELRVDGHSFGVVLAREEAGSRIATRDEVIFERSERGHLVLASLALEGQRVRTLYRLEVGNSVGTWQAVTAPRATRMAVAK